MNKVLNRQVDIEWIQLIQEARNLGISKEDIRLFFRKNIEANQSSFDSTLGEELHKSQ